MKTRWIVLSSLCMALLSPPFGAVADPTTSKCATIGDDYWGGARKTLPKNQASIDMLKKLAVDCPAIAGSMERLANDMTAYLKKQDEARRRLQQMPEYNPGTFNAVAGALSSF
ncbi:MAG TPA: hypothetical protein VJQ25_00590 [Nitrospira sp.]|nr:hypothetical protein [Nitrospira sp.]